MSQKDALRTKNRTILYLFLGLAVLFYGVALVKFGRMFP